MKLGAWNWKPENGTLVFMDIETQSTCNLRAVGSQAYLRHSSTRLMSCVFKHGDELITWVPTGRMPRYGKVTVDRGTLHVGDDAPECVRDWIGKGYTFVAHNASGFDREAWARLVGGNQPTWFDTAFPARAGGLPGALGELSKALFGEDKLDNKAMVMLSTAKITRNAIVWYPPATVPLWEEMLRYNVQDVLLLEKVYGAVLPYLEPDLLQVHCAINDHGCMVDLPFARQVYDLWHENAANARSRVEIITNGELSESDLSSVPKVKAWIAKQGLQLPIDAVTGNETLNRQAIQELLDTADDDSGDERIEIALEVLRLRASATRATQGKVARVFDVVDDDSHVRGMHRYYGAHTGRFSATGLQPHNMVRPHEATGYDSGNGISFLEMLWSKSKG